MKKFMKLALKEAYAGMRSGNGGPFGAVIVRKGKVIAKAHNKVFSTGDPTAHAEIVAIRKASAKLKRLDLSYCEIYSSCEPCPMCYSAARWAKIKKIFFGCISSDAEKIGFGDNGIYNELRGKSKKKIIEKQIFRKECLAVFEEWKNKKGKKIY
ncbi:MAG: nucleoside deaminase [Candidatus ainarchaeum sp.]|nr:nucleoside deaminase [Candidatus ainarchaeum sp.]